MISIKQKLYVSAIMLMGILAGCSLDYNEEDFFTDTDFFNDFQRTRAFLDGIYNRLPSGFNEIGGAMRASASDDAIEADDLSNVKIFMDGRWQANQTIDDKWAEMYEGIRAANVLLINLDETLLEDFRFSDDYGDQLTQYRFFDEEARFLRAFFYFELMKRYGGVPVLYGEVLELSDLSRLERGTLDEVKQYIVGECNAIISALPPTPSFGPGGPHEGKPTSGAAKALKARTLLYAASSLNGSTQIEWEEAAEAAHEIISDGFYTLDDYENVVNDSRSTELILGRRIQPSNSFEVSNFPVGFASASPGTCPTQNLVDTYEMVNGMDINEPGSGYDPQNPYANRDPRLLSSVIVNNSMWKGRRVQVWNGGLDGAPKELASPTGYYLKKYLVPSISIAPNNSSSARHLWVYFRYSEVLLNFAEAMNEAYGPNADPKGYGLTAVDAMNQLRTKRGVAEYSGTDIAEARQEIRDERRVELAFEDHRFWDLRRWEIGAQASVIRGMEVTYVTDSTFSFSEKMVENRMWDDRMNLYPIPQLEIFNTRMQQNPGW